MIAEKENNGGTKLSIKQIAERNKLITKMVLYGETLVGVANDHALSPERVRQIVYNVCAENNAKLCGSARQSEAYRRGVNVLTLKFFRDNRESFVENSQ